jgi:predicted dehydrogenase
VSGYNPLQARGTGNGIIINPDPVNTYLAEIEEFSSSILENRQPIISFARGLHSQKVIEACYQSARSGTVIELF